jgi:hypothetical protein
MNSAAVEGAEAPKRAQSLRSGSTPAIAESVRRGRLAMILAFAVFMLAKSAWILLPTATMGGPRLGDDALVYLWVGTSNVFDAKIDTPAVKDIVELRKRTQGGDPGAEYLTARTTMRTTNVSTSPVSFALDGLLKLGLSQTSAFAVSELVTAAVLAAGILSFLAVTVGPLPAAAALAMLSVTMLPGQGLHYLIPGVLTLGLGLLLWAELAQNRARLVLIAAFCMAASLTHQIGLVYIAIGCGYVGIRTLVRALPVRSALIQLASVAAGMIAARLFDLALGKQIPPTAGMGAISLAGADANLLEGLAAFSKILLTAPFLCVLAIVGLILHLRVRDGRLPTFLLLLFGAFFAATAFYVEGYPGELTRRLTVVIAILSAGFAGVAIEASLRRRTAIMIAVGLFVALHFASQSVLSYGAYWRNVNNRAAVYDAAGLRRELAALPPDASIVWTDPDITMMAAFLEGAWRYRALPFPMVEGGGQVDQIIAEWKPSYIAAAPPEKMNTLSALRSKSFTPRYYGVSLDDVEDVEIALAPGTPGLFIRLSRSVDQQDLIFSARSAEGDCPPPEWRQVKAGSRGWIEVDLSRCPGAAAVKVISSRHGLALVGLQSRTPRPGVNWPWGEAMAITGESKTRKRASVAFRFDWEALLGPALASRLVDRSPEAVTADESGVVWVRSPLRTSGG